ncbi:hypothetical protein [Kocuria palustris]|uniref:hypothetical protein n=1 Tax=Kocuria palustris TaxID=71999 RepID=UPI0011A476A4|nr:hypothetical protein [Kocuria palustris]
MQPSSGPKRRTAGVLQILVLAVALLFAALGILVAFAGAPLVGIVAVAFFGGCALVLASQLLGAGSGAAPVLMGLGCVGMGVGCLGMAAAALSGPNRTAGDWATAAVPLIGAAFFGLGGVVLLLMPLLLRGRAVAVASPVLSLTEVEARLDARLAELGAMGGAVGGGFGAGTAGTAAGSAGGAHGAGVGSRHLTRLDGAEAELAAPRDPELVRAVRQELFGGAADEAWSGPGGSVLHMTGMVGSGWAGLNPCIVQLVWTERGLSAAAHAREGLARQRTCSRALERLTEILSR